MAHVRPDNKFNETEFEVFFKKYYKLAICISLEITDNLIVSEDIVQDIFLWIWNNAEIIRTGDSLKQLLIRSVKNKSLNYIRDRKNTLDISLMDSTLKEDEQESDANERIVQILQAIEDLPPRCREIFDMVIFQEKKYLEVADQLGVSINTVKTQMGIAYKQLRKNIKISLKSFTLFLVSCALVGKNTNHGAGKKQKVLGRGSR